MARVTTVYASAYQKARKQVSSFVQGEVFSLTFNVNAALASGVTLASADWQVTNASSLSLGAESIDGNNASVVCTAAASPGAYVKCTATASDGSVFVQVFDICIEPGPFFSA